MQDLLAQRRKRNCCDFLVLLLILMLALKSFAEISGRLKTPRFSDGLMFYYAVFKAYAIHMAGPYKRRGAA